MFSREQLHWPCAVCAVYPTQTGFQGCSSMEYLAAAHSWLNQTYRGNCWEEITSLAQQPIDGQHSVLSQKRSPQHIFFMMLSSSILVLNLWDLAPVIETMKNAWLEPFLAEKKPTQNPEKSFHKSLLWIRRGNTLSQWHLCFWQSVGQGERWCTEPLICHSA